MSVLSLDAVRAATANVRRECIEIIELCNLAGKPGLAAEFIREGLTADSARRRLETTQAPGVQPGKQLPSAGNGTVAFDLAWIERQLAAARTLQ